MCWSRHLILTEPDWIGAAPGTDLDNLKLVIAQEG